MNDGAIVPFSKKLGKLSILILEGYIRSKVGDGFVDELGKPFIKQEKLAKVLEHTEYRFLKLYDDKDLAHAMFVDLKQSDRPVLRESILKFLDHPTNPDFPAALREILATEFSVLESERINNAVITYLNLLTEELSLEDSEFREKMVALISIRGGNLWSNALSIKSDNSKDITPRKADIILEGNFQSFTRKKKAELVRIIAILLNIDPEHIRILSVKPGSIIVRLVIPGYALLTLIKLILDESLELRKTGVLSVRTKGEIYKYTKDLRITVIGQGSVGKTSLVMRLIEDMFSNSRNKTEGIDIKQWRVKIKGERFKMHVWDFGGQEIMHGTHQFFLSKNTLYLLILDSRLTEEENRLDYWVETIKAFAEESPIIIVRNKTDLRKPESNQDEIMQKYSNVESVCDISCLTGDGISDLKHAIGSAIRKIPYYLELSLPLFAIKHKIGNIQSNYVSYQEFQSFCKEEGIFDVDVQREFAGYLHEMGIVLYFRDSVNLEDVIILNPQWVTRGIYKILNSLSLFENKGVLTVSMLNEILNLPEYPREKRLFIVDMMKKFELCYDIEPDKTFLVPDLLPKDQPDLKFNGVPAFEYAYPVLPSSVITRFIARMNQKIEKQFVWRTGVVLKIGKNTALVKADIEDRKITVAIGGVEHTRRDALSAIRYQLDEIHNSIKGLEPEKRVPIPEAPNAEPIKYEYLLKMKQAGQMTILVDNGNYLARVNVHDILNNIESRAQLLEAGVDVTNIYVSGNFGGNLTVGDGNRSIKDNYNKITSAKIDAELKEAMKQLAEAVDAMIQKLPADQAAEVAEDFGRLTDEAVKPKPNQKWYSVSIEGLIKAAENLDKLGTPVISLSRKVLSLLTGGVIK